MGKTLLLADDSVTIQKVVGISFASEDITLVTVDNGDDAITRARAVRPDVILADVVMPGKSGYEVCEAIKADAALRHIPVLLLTGTFEAFDNERAARAGAAGHIAKPFEAQALVERVKRLLAAPPAAQPAAAAAKPAAAPQPQPAARPAPARPAAPPPAPPAAPAAARSEDAFEFFDDSAAAPAAAVRTATAESQLGNSLDFDADGGDNAFAFGDDELATPPPKASRSSAAAHTVAMLPETPAADPDVPEEGLSFDSADADADLELATPTPRAVAAEPFEAGERFDFEFDTAGSDLRDTSVEPVATVIDPAAGADYDVSSSDLRAALSPNAATRLMDPDEAPAAPRFGEDPVVGMLEGDLDDGEAPLLEADPADESFEITQPSARAPRAEAEQTFREEPAPPPLRSAPPARPAAPAPMRSAPAREAQRDVSAMAEDAMARVAPALREQLHETLEKIAWEAFGRVAESIVEQAVERLEKTAWEVVPRLAETLILEEIRKLKGEPSDD
jgi:CheY-like chemotaxis protein